MATPVLNVLSGDHGGWAAVVDEARGGAVAPGDATVPVTAVRVVGDADTAPHADASTRQAIVPRWCRRGLRNMAFMEGRAQGITLRSISIVSHP
jgi:hypothetical protein